MSAGVAATAKHGSCCGQQHAQAQATPCCCDKGKAVPRCCGTQNSCQSSGQVSDAPLSSEQVLSSEQAHVELASETADALNGVGCECATCDCEIGQVPVDRGQRETVVPSSVTFVDTDLFWQWKADFFAATRLVAIPPLTDPPTQHTRRALLCVWLN